LSRARLLALLSLTFVFTAAFDGRTGASPAGAPGWERKLDPFLRRLALGTRRSEGRFSQAVPGHPGAAARTPPPLPQVSRGTANPIVHVKAGLRDDAQARGRGWQALRPALREMGVDIRGRVGPIASLSVPAEAIERLAGLDAIAWLKTAHAYHLQND